MLTALAQALPEGEALDLAAQLPNELQEAVQSAAAQDPVMDRDRFRARVAELAQAPEAETEGLARAVLAQLQDSVSFGNIADAVTALPGGIADLVGTRRS